jgi:hypothetical protein
MINALIVCVFMSRNKSKFRMTISSKDLSTNDINILLHFKAAEEIGVRAQHLLFPRDITQQVWKSN